MQAVIEHEEDDHFVADFKRALQEAARSAAAGRGGEPGGDNAAPRVPRRSTADTVHVKLTYMKKQKSVDTRRPANLAALQKKIEEMFEVPNLVMYYTNRDREMLVPVITQEALDLVVRLADDAGRSVRLMLSKHAMNASSAGSVARLPSAQCHSAPTGRFSPPIGTSVRTPPSAGGSHRHSRTGGSRRSVNSEVMEVAYASSTSSYASSRPGIGVDNWLSRASSSGSSSLVQEIGSAQDGNAHEQTCTCGTRVEVETESLAAPRAPLNWRQGPLLGSGSFGHVFLCYDAESGADLAVKRVLLHSDHDKRQLAALDNELTRLKYVQHARIVQYLGVQRDEHAMHIFMELMPGTIKGACFVHVDVPFELDEIRQNGALTERVACKYTWQVLDGLAYLHHIRIVHRDIKSTNILRDGKGNVKIGDFGSAKQLQTVCSANGDTFIGTPHYIAPEMILGKHTTSAVDIWALGITMVEMLTSKVPWHELAHIAVILRVAYEQPVYTLPDNISAHVPQLLHMMFTRRPEQRPSARDLLRHAAFAADTQTL